MRVWLSVYATTGDVLETWQFLETDAQFWMTYTYTLTKNVLYILVDAWNCVLFI